jgi:hypothetical protein
MRTDFKRGNIPEVGDLYKDPKYQKIWMLMEISFDKQKNTDVVYCKNMMDGQFKEMTFSFMYIKKHWEYMA